MSPKFTFGSAHLLMMVVVYVEKCWQVQLVDQVIELYFKIVFFPLQTSHFLYLSTSNTLGSEFLCD
jgi:hypothetical protein